MASSGNWKILFLVLATCGLFNFTQALTQGERRAEDPKTTVAPVDDLKTLVQKFFDKAMKVVTNNDPFQVEHLDWDYNSYGVVFRERAVKESLKLRDRPMEVLDEAVYWIEYILRHGGAHLQPNSKHLSWYSRALLDVSLFLLALISLCIFILYAITAFCINRCRRFLSKSPSQRKKTQ